MDMDKSKDVVSENKVNKKLLVLGLALAFSAGAFVKGEIAKHEDKSADVCRVTLYEYGNDTVISTQGSAPACTPILDALRNRMREETQDDGDGDATEDQSAPCDPASAPEGASQ